MRSWRASSDKSFCFQRSLYRSIDQTQAQLVARHNLLPPWSFLPSLGEDFFGDSAGDLLTGLPSFEPGAELTVREGLLDRHEVIADLDGGP
jgi:hypothetical protein